MISVHTHDNPTGRGAEPRILMESTEPLTLEGAAEVEDAVPGDCIIQVPEVRGPVLSAEVHKDATNAASIFKRNVVTFCDLSLVEKASGNNVIRDQVLHPSGAGAAWVLCHGRIVSIASTGVYSSASGQGTAEVGDRLESRGVWPRGTASLRRRPQ